MSETAEQGIRAYLEGLGTKPARPRPTVDREAVRAVKDQIKAATDPIEKLRLHRELAEVSTPRLPEVEEDPGHEAVFIEHARSWAESEGIPLDAFAALKVPVSVLQRAGLPTTGARRPSSGGSSGGSRGPIIRAEDVLKAARDLVDGFRLTELAAALGREVATVRNHVNTLVERGDLIVTGEDASRQGRPAKLYKLR